MDFRRTAAALGCVLDLSREAVAVDLARTEAEFAELPAARLKGKLSFCAMVRLASMGHGRKALAGNFGCRGSAEVFRFVEPTDDALSGERLHGFGLYASPEIAAQVQASMARVPAPCLGVATLPLGACAREPRVVILFVNAYQAMRAVQGWAYHFGPVREVFQVGNRGICAECAARPMTSGTLNLSPLCANTRFTARWPDHELGLGVPFPRLEALLDGIVRTIAATETGARKKALAARCAAAGVDLSPS